MYSDPFFLNGNNGGYGAMPQQPYGYGGYALPPGYANMLYQRPPESAGASLVRGLPAAYYQFKGMNTRPMENIGASMGNIADAIGNPDNPLYQKIYNQEKGQAQQDLAAALQEMSNQNRKLSALGRTPLFNPERGGEQMFRAQVSGYQDAQNQARSRARDILTKQLGAQQDNFNAQSAIAQNQLKNNAMSAGGFGSIADFLPSLMKMF